MAPDPKKVQLGQAFVERILAHIPEDKRAAAQEAILGSPEALAEVGEGTLRRDDYSRVRDAQTKWWTENQEKLSEYDRLKAAAGDGNDPNLQRQPIITDPLKAPITREDFNREGRALELESVRLNAQIATITARHHVEFGEALDMSALVDKSLETGVPLPQLYNDTVAERRATKQKEVFDKQIADAEARGEQRAAQRIMSQKGEGIPYPVGSSAPTTLSGLKLPEDRRNTIGVDAAVATLVEEMNKSNATT